MRYVYKIRSLSDPTKIYVGETQDLKQRLSQHNAGVSPHTKKHMPWELDVYVAFKEKDKAINFERYLKHGSGHAFSKRHF